MIFYFLTKLCVVSFSQTDERERNESENSRGNQTHANNPEKMFFSIIPVTNICFIYFVFIWRGKTMISKKVKKKNKIRLFRERNSGQHAQNPYRQTSLNINDYSGMIIIFQPSPLKISFHSRNHFPSCREMTIEERSFLSLSLSLFVLKHIESGIAAPFCLWEIKKLVGGDDGGGIDWWRRPLLTATAVPVSCLFAYRMTTKKSQRDNFQSSWNPFFLAPFVSESLKQMRPAMTSPTLCRDGSDQIINHHFFGMKTKKKQAIPLN